MQQICIAFALFFLLIVDLNVTTSGVDGAYIERNAYKGVSISFSRNVRQEHFNFEKLKEVLRKSSEYIFDATRRRSHFSEFIVTLPSTWKNDLCENSVATSPPQVDIYITDAGSGKLQAQHSRGCGEGGELIYMPLTWLRGDTNDLARQFVQQWSIYRYGVFEEKPAESESCFHKDANSWAPVGCYNVDIEEKPDMSEQGLPICHIRDSFYSREDLASSIMFTVNTTKTLNFCDGSKDFPHNPLMPTRHNNICRGKPTWTVVTNSEDFKYGSNPPIQDFPQTETSFKCFQEPGIQLTLAVQNSSTEDISKTVEDIRYSLHRFLYYDLLKEDTKVNLVTFSDENYKDINIPHSVDLENLVNLQSFLTTTIRTIGKVDRVCMTCGLQKALNISRQNPHPSPTVVLIALESAVGREKTSDLLREIQNFSNERLYLLLIQDTPDDVIPFELAEAVRRTGGQVFNLPPMSVSTRSRMNLVLVNVVKSPLHLEDSIVVVHEANYIDIRADFVDEFTTEGELNGRMVYTLQCNQSSLDPTCPTLVMGDNTCVKVTELIAETDGGSKRWTHNYRYLGSMYPMTCSSLVTVQIHNNSNYPTTLRGWLNHYTIKPGRETLIIYAEIIQILNVNYRVWAQIFGPGSDNILHEKLELFDNGNGDPDMKKDDGIYSRYFTRFHQKGTYLITLYAATTETEGNVSKTAVIGSFSVTEDPPKLDIYPPNRIGDLRVASMDHDNNTVTLSWTAPGDDYDYGSTTQYIIKYSIHWAELLLDISFDMPDILCLPTANNEDIKPVSSGLTENKIFQLPRFQHDKVYYIALRAADSSNNTGLISNIVQLHVRSSTDPLISTETATISSNSTETDENYFSITTRNDTETETTSTTSEENATIPPTDVATIENCLNRDFVILIAASAGGGSLAFIIIVNIIVCCCVFRKSEKEPKRLSKKDSLRPPHNLNIAYRKEESIDIDVEDHTGSSLNSLVDRNIYSSPQGTAAKQEFTYNNYGSHSMRTRQEPDRNRSPRMERNDFKLVTAMPAYATTSLSRYVNRINNPNDTINSTEFKPRTVQPQQISQFANTVGDSQVYPLGLV